MKEVIEPRQIGIVLDLDRSYDQLEWKKNGLWTYYPENHIDRLEGTAKAFDGKAVNDLYGPRQEPLHSWPKDVLSFGSNDFRSTKHDVKTVFVSNGSGSGIRLKSIGSGQHVRCWMDKEFTKMLIANYSNSGGEHYFSFQSGKNKLILSPNEETDYYKRSLHGWEGDIDSSVQLNLE